VQLIDNTIGIRDWYRNIDRPPCNYD